MIEQIQHAIRAITRIEDLVITQNQINDPAYIQVHIKGTDYCLYVKRGHDYKVIYHVKFLVETILEHISKSEGNSYSFNLIREEIKNILESSKDFCFSDFNEEKCFSFLNEKTLYALIRDNQVIINNGLDKFTIDTSEFKLRQYQEISMPVRLGELYGFRTSYYKIIVLSNSCIDDIIKSNIQLQMVFLNKMYENHLYLSKLKDINLELEELILRRTAEIVEKNKELEEEKIKLDAVNRELIQLNKKLELLSRIEPLTGLSNRRDFEDKYNALIFHSYGKFTSFGIIIADIDGFKSINDTYGHECGDRVLIRIADIFKKNLRINDAVSRYGGDEFITLLYDIDLYGLKIIAEKLREKIFSEFFECRDKAFNITMSFGACVFNGMHKIDHCLSTADKYLYQAKASGRNKVAYCDHIIEASSD